MNGISGAESMSAGTLVPPDSTSWTVCARWSAVAVLDTNPRAPARIDARTSSLFAVPEMTAIGVLG